MKRDMVRQYTNTTDGEADKGYRYGAFLNFFRHLGYARRAVGGRRGQPRLSRSHATQERSARGSTSGALGYVGAEVLADFAALNRGKKNYLGGAWLKSIRHAEISLV